MKNQRITIFDTTLRDGEQCPGASMNTREKLEVARKGEHARLFAAREGYASASAFTAMVKRTLGAPPTHFFA